MRPNIPLFIVAAAIGANAAWLGYEVFKPKSPQQLTAQAFNPGDDVPSWVLNVEELDKKVSSIAPSCPSPKRGDDTLHFTEGYRGIAYGGTPCSVSGAKVTFLMDALAERRADGTVLVTCFPHDRHSEEEGCIHIKPTALVRVGGKGTVISADFWTPEWQGKYIVFKTLEWKQSL